MFQHDTAMFCNQQIALSECIWNFQATSDLILFLVMDTVFAIKLVLIWFCHMKSFLHGRHLFPILQHEDSFWQGKHLLMSRYIVWPDDTSNNIWKSLYRHGCSCNNTNDYSNSIDMCSFNDCWSIQSDLFLN